MRPKRTLAATLATAALALGAPAAPQARTYNCSGTNVYDGQSWNHVLCGMPDFDQRRATDETVGGLPGDGEMYCVPATAVNAMAYLSSHGFPELGPGPADLETGAANYANVTGAIAETMDSGGYTYARLQGAGKDVWVAAPQFDAKVGVTVAASTVRIATPSPF